jgi:hypothetical protein
MSTTVAGYEVEFVTDPITDDESEDVMRALPGWCGFRGSPIRDGTPRASRSRFVVTRSDLDGGGLDARLDVLARYGIAVHRIVGEHAAVRRTNRRLGYLEPT